MSEATANIAPVDSAFSIVPVPPEAEGLDAPYTPSDKKFSCDEGIYEAVVTAMLKVPAKPYKDKQGIDQPGKDKVKFEVVLTQDAVKGIKASRNYDLTGDFQFILEKTAAAFGVSPNKETKVLPLASNYHNIVAKPCRAKVKPREFNGKTFMEIVEILPALAKANSEAAPF